jgi:hypothetical protein
MRNTKKLTVEIDAELNEKIKLLARRRGQNLAEFTTSVFTNALSADKIMDLMRKEAAKDCLKWQINKDRAA